MDSGFFGAPERAFGFAFHGFPLDRVAERRDEEAFLASLKARSDAEAILVGRDMPVLTRTQARRFRFPYGEIAAFGGAAHEALLGLADDGRPVYAVD